MNPNSVSSHLSARKKQELVRLERMRNLIARKWLIWLALILATVLISWVLSLLFGQIKIDKGDDMTLMGYMLGFCFFIWGAYSISMKFPIQEELHEAYRKQILPSLVEHALPNWTCASNHGLTLKQVLETGLFREQANQFLREDFFSGPAGSGNAEVFEMTIRRQLTSSYRTGRGGIVRQTEIQHGFYGYLFAIDSIQSFVATCWVFPKQKRARLETDNWIDAPQKELKQKFYLLETGNPTFDGRYNLYCNQSRIPAQMNHSLQTELVRLGNYWSGVAAFTFRGNQLYALVGFEQDPLSIQIHIPLANQIETKHQTELVKMRDYANALAKAVQVQGERG
jgi:hypothetical protein